MGSGDLLGKPNKLWGSDLQWTSIRPGGVEILLAASCYRNRDKLRQYEPVWLIRLHQPARWATWLVCRLNIKMAVVWVFVMLWSLSYNIPIYNHPVYNLDYFGWWCNVGCTNGM